MYPPRIYLEVHAEEPQTNQCKPLDCPVRLEHTVKECTFRLTFPGPLPSPQVNTQPHTTATTMEHPHGSSFSLRLCNEAKINRCLFLFFFFQSLSSKTWYYWTSVVGISLVSSCHCQMVNFNTSGGIIKEMKNPA